MDKILIVIDMQNDFISGSLGSPYAKFIVPKVVEKVKNYDGRVYFTKDTHYDDYLNTLEGQKLPIEHCKKGTIGWEICPELKPYVKKNTVVEKRTFGFTDWAYVIQRNISSYKYTPDEIEICGLCTDICVVNNALILRALYPNTKIIVNEELCAGTTYEAHKAALTTMKSCQIDIIEAESAIEPTLNLPSMEGFSPVPGFTLGDFTGFCDACLNDPKNGGDGICHKTYFCVHAL